MSFKLNLKFGSNVLELETGRMAKQANGAVFASCGGTAVIATVCCSDSADESLDFVPLSVEYNEKYYAAGKIPGGFIKRETKPKEKEILISRLIDRPLRPLLFKSFKREIQVIPTTVSADQIIPSDIIAIIASSVAVSLSDIPFDGPVSAARISYVNGHFLVNPTFKEIKESELDIVVAGTKYGITMVEGGAKEQSEEVMLEAISIAEKEIRESCIAIEEFAKKYGKEKLPLLNEPVLHFKEELFASAYPKLKKACFINSKIERRKAIEAAYRELEQEFAEKISDDDKKLFIATLDDLRSTVLRDGILNEKLRIDGRGLDEIRPITCEVDVLKRAHGSSLFTRGETQALVVTTLGTVDDGQITDDIDGDKKSNFLLHYNFPPFSVGEVGRLNTGRREIGHGHLAFRALESLIPKKEDFPYTIRVVSEILESNGSSSMATVCGGSLSLMTAGIPIKKSVAGIAMGLIFDNEDKFSVITDILGDEDHLGDMDFKVAGTRDGITAFQLDIKVKSISKNIFEIALRQAKEGRLKILSIMDKSISSNKSSLSSYAPKIISFGIDPDKIGAVIGSGGKNIRSIDERWDVKINIENDGMITIYSNSEDSIQGAKRDILGIINEPEIGAIYNGVVKKITDFGAFIEFLPGKEGLCHISKLSAKRVEKVEDVLKINQEVKVKIISIDKIGRVGLVPVFEE